MVLSTRFFFRFCVGLLALVAASPAHAQDRNYHWHPIANVQPPYFGGESYDLAEFANRVASSN